MESHSLPYRVFSKDQRVSHTAVVENKRLSHALTLIEAQQEQDPKYQPKVKTNSEKDGYQKRARKIYGPPEEAKFAVGAGSGEIDHRTTTTRVTPTFLMGEHPCQF